MLEGKARLLREKGLGKKQKKTNSLTRQEEDILWECDQLDDKTLKSIISTLWWQLTQHFGNQQYINSMMKDFIPNSTFQNSEKQLANHSARKTLRKKLKQQQVSKSEIISITERNREEGLDAYDGGEEVQQKQLFHFIGNNQPTASKNKYFISPNNLMIRNPSFSFFPNDDQIY